MRSLSSLDISCFNCIYRESVHNDSSCKKEEAGSGGTGRIHMCCRIFDVRQMEYQQI